MPYVAIQEDVYIDPKSALRECSLDELTDEVMRRADIKREAEPDPKFILPMLRRLNCPREVYLLVEAWAFGKQSLSDVMALTK